MPLHSSAHWTTFIELITEIEGLGKKHQGMLFRLKFSLLATRSYSMLFLELGQVMVHSKSNFYFQPLMREYSSDQWPQKIMKQLLTGGKQGAQLKIQLLGGGKRPGEDRDKNAAMNKEGRQEGGEVIPSPVLPPDLVLTLRVPLGSWLTSDQRGREAYSFLPTLSQSPAAMTTPDVTENDWTTRWELPSPLPFMMMITRPGMAG